MHHDLFREIQDRYSTLSPAEKRVARVILSDYPLSGLRSIAAIAQRANVSDPTVLRFVIKLGCKRYGDFQESLKKDLDQRLRGPLAVSPDSSLLDPSDSKAYFSHFSSELIKNIEQTFNSLSPQEVDGVLRVLSNTSNAVHIIGGQFTENLANHLYFHLRKIRPGIHMISGQSVSRLDYLLNLGKKDVLLVFDVRRYQVDLEELVKRAEKLVSSIILVTDEWLSPIAGSADYVLSCKVSSPSRWDSLAAMSAVIEALISELTDADWTSVEKRLKEIERLRDEIFPNPESVIHPRHSRIRFEQEPQ